jgi:thermostable 8-oxoguanine DNA glycosylase
MVYLSSFLNRLTDPALFELKDKKLILFELNICILCALASLHETWAFQSRLKL